MDQNFKMIPTDLDKDLFLSVARILLQGYIISFRDSYQLNFDTHNTVEIDLKEHQNQVYVKFLNANYDVVSEFFNQIGYELSRIEYPTSQLDEFRNSYVLKWKYIDQTRPRNVYNLDKVKLLICGCIFLETSSGTLFIELNRFIDRLVKDPGKVLRKEIDFETLFEFVSPRTKDHSLNPENIESLKQKIKNGLKELINRDYVLLVKSREGNEFISSGPGTFQLTKIISELKEEETDDT